MPEIPEQLKWYTPLKRSSRNVNVPVPWRVSVDAMTRCIEVKRAPYFSPFYVIVGLCVAALFGGVGYYGYTLEPDEKTRATLAAFMICVPVALFLFLQLLGVAIVAIDSLYWGFVRFRYNPENGELFFGKENLTYRPKDYSKLVIACVRGTEKEDASKEWGLVEVTQVFVLLLDRNDRWRRYTLSDDIVHWKTSETGSTQFMRLVDSLQPLLAFEQFVRDYSKEECDEQQQKAQSKDCGSICPSNS